MDLDIECRYQTNLAEPDAQILEPSRQHPQIHTNSYEPLFHLLKSKPELQSLNIFRGIRFGSDVTTLTLQIETEDLPLQRSIERGTTLQYEFPYNPSMPVLLQIANNPYLNSTIYRIACGQPESSLSSKLEYPNFPLTPPVQAAQLIDSRISKIRISHWTTITSDDQLAGSLLQTYLMYEHLTITAFKKDYFLDDMLAGRDQFCSPLLVNAVLAAAGVSYDTTRIAGWTNFVSMDVGCLQAVPSHGIRIRCGTSFLRRRNDCGN